MPEVKLVKGSDLIALFDSLHMLEHIIAARQVVEDCPTCKRVQQQFEQYEKEQR